MLFWSCAWLASEVVISERFVSRMLYLISCNEPRVFFLFFFKRLVWWRCFYILARWVLGSFTQSYLKLVLQACLCTLCFFLCTFCTVNYFFLSLWLSCFRVYTHNMQLYFVHNCLLRRRRNLKTYKWWLYFVRYLVHFLCGEVFCTYVYTT